MTAPNNVKVAALSFNSNGDNTAIAAVAGSPIVVWKVAFTTAAAVNVTFYDGASPTTPLSGALVFSAAGSMVLDGPEGFPLFRTTLGNALVMNLSGGVAIGGVIWYSLA